MNPRPVKLHILPNSRVIIYAFPKFQQHQHDRVLRYSRSFGFLLDKAMYFSGEPNLCYCHFHLPTLLTFPSPTEPYIASPNPSFTFRCCLSRPHAAETGQSMTADPCLTLPGPASPRPTSPLLNCHDEPCLSEQRHSKPLLNWPIHYCQSYTQPSHPHSSHPILPIQATHRLDTPLHDCPSATYRTLANRNYPKLPRRSLTEPSEPNTANT